MELSNATIGDRIKIILKHENIKSCDFARTINVKRAFIILYMVIMFNIVMFNLNAYAKVGDIVGKIYSTDIVCDVDGIKIPSYNIGGETAISVEKLKDYGFDVEWIEKDRRLIVSIGKLPDMLPQYDLPKTNNIGDVVGNIYETDIKVYFGLYSVNPEKTYNIGGETLVSVEELGDINSNYIDPYLNNMFPMLSYNSFEDIGYSKYCFKTEWNSDDRTISLKSLRKGTVISSDIGDMRVEGIKRIGEIDDYKFQEYDDFLDIIDALNLEYNFKDGILSVNQNQNSKDLYEKKIYGTNKGFINYDLIMVTVDTISGEKIDGFVSFGKFSINLDDFAKISGYNHYYNSSESLEVLSKK